MEKYFHLPSKRPADGAVIFTLRGKIAKVEGVSPLNWVFIKQNIDKWAYVHDLLQDLDNLQKYVRAYNYYRDRVKNVIEVSTNTFTKRELSDIYKNATDIIRSEQ